MTCNRKGVTLVEVLVNIAIIGLLISLLLPAIQSARESARRIQCADHFRQVGIGMQNYHAAKRVFPTGLFHWQAPANGSDDTPVHCAWPPEDEEPIRDEDYYGWGWGTFLLPYIEEDALYSRFAFKRGPGGKGCTVGENYRAGATFVDTYLCPSDPQGDELVTIDYFIPGGASQTNDVGPDPENDKDFARTNMAGVMGAGALNRADGKPLSNGDDDPNQFGVSCPSSVAPRSNANGMLFNRSRVSAADVTDGLSKTLLVGEVRGGRRGSYRGYFWVTWNIAISDNGLNNVEQQLVRANQYPKNDWRGEPAGGFASHHPGGCHFLLADGSVQFLRDSISQEVLQAMSTRKGGETLDTE